MTELKGRRLQDLQSADKIMSGDLLPVITVPGEDLNTYYSAAADVSSFVQECMSDCTGLEFGSAARMNSADFSPFDHRHDGLYNRLSIEQLVSDGTTQISVGNFQDAGCVYRPLMAPLQSIPPIIVQPEIGLLKFVALPFTSDIDENADGFDGWCWADGRSLPTSEWPDAFKTFGYSYSAEKSGETFQIPNFERFMRPISSSIYNCSIQPYDVYIPDHIHSANMTLTGDVKIEMQLSVTNKPYGSGIALHAAKSGTTSLKVFNNPENSINIDVDSFSIAGEILSAGEDEEAYPRHVNIPVLIYIGRRKAATA